MKDYGKYCIFNHGHPCEDDDEATFYVDVYENTEDGGADLIDGFINDCLEDLEETITNEYPEITFRGKDYINMPKGYKDKEI